MVPDFFPGFVRPAGCSCFTGCGAGYKFRRVQHYFCSSTSVEWNVSLTTIDIFFDVRRSKFFTRIERETINLRAYIGPLRGANVASLLPEIHHFCGLRFAVSLCGALMH